MKTIRTALEGLDTIDEYIPEDLRIKYKLGEYAEPNGLRKLKEVMLGLSDLKLRGVYCRCNTANAAMEIVIHQQALTRLVKASVPVKCQGRCGDDRSAFQFL